MTTTKNTVPEEVAAQAASLAREAPAAEQPQGLVHLLAEIQALALVMPATDRTDAEIEADFDNMPI